MSAGGAQTLVSLRFIRLNSLTRLNVPPLQENRS
jgi:hypothetical protein